MGEVWERGKGYTEQVETVPAVVIQARELSGDAMARRRRRRNRPETVLTWVATGMAAAVVTLLAYQLGRMEGREDLVDRRRIERWEDRLDGIDETATQLFDPELSAPERQVLELRLEHLQRSWCQDVDGEIDEVPNHLRQAYGQVCEGG